MAVPEIILRSDRFAGVQFALFRRLGGGASGEAWETEVVFNDRSYGLFAIKIFSPRDHAFWEREASVLRVLSEPPPADFTPRVLHSEEALPVPWTWEGARCVRIATPVPRPVLVLTLGEMGSLHDVLLRGPLPESVARRLFRQLLLAIQACHQRFVFHRDIKLDNIVLDGRGNLVLIDFSHAFHAPSPDCAPYSVPCTLSGGTAGWKAPELLRASLQSRNREPVDPYSAAQVDVFSAGCVLFSLLTGAMVPWSFFEPPAGIVLGAHPDNPYFRAFMDDPSYIAQIYAREGLVLPGGPLGSACDLIAFMLHHEPASRATIEEALAHPWVADPNDRVADHADQCLALLRHHIRGSKGPKDASAPIESGSYRGGDPGGRAGQGSHSSEDRDRARPASAVLPSGPSAVAAVAAAADDRDGPDPAGYGNDNVADAEADAWRVRLVVAHAGAIASLAEGPGVGGSGYTGMGLSGPLGVGGEGGDLAGALIGVSLGVSGDSLGLCGGSGSGRGGGRGGAAGASRVGGSAADDGDEEDLLTALNRSAAPAGYGGALMRPVDRSGSPDLFGSFAEPAMRPSSTPGSRSTAFPATPESSSVSSSSSSSPTAGSGATGVVDDDRWALDDFVAEAAVGVAGVRDTSSADRIERLSSGAEAFLASMDFLADVASRTHSADSFRSHGSIDSTSPLSAGLFRPPSNPSLEPVTTRSALPDAPVDLPRLLRRVHGSFARTAAALRSLWSDPTTTTTTTSATPSASDAPALRNAGTVVFAPPQPAGPVGLGVRPLALDVTTVGAHAALRLVLAAWSVTAADTSREQRALLSALLPTASGALSSGFLWRHEGVAAREALARLRDLPHAIDPAWFLDEAEYIDAVVLAAESAAEAAERSAEPSSGEEDAAERRAISLAMAASTWSAFAGDETSLAVPGALLGPFARLQSIAASASTSASTSASASASAPVSGASLARTTGARTTALPATMSASAPATALLEGAHRPLPAPGSSLPRAVSESLGADARSLFPTPVPTSAEIPTPSPSPSLPALAATTSASAPGSPTVHPTASDTNPALAALPLPVLVALAQTRLASVASVGEGPARARQLARRWRGSSYAGLTKPSQLWTAAAEQFAVVRILDIAFDGAGSALQASVLVRRSAPGRAEVEEFVAPVHVQARPRTDPSTGSVAATTLEFSTVSATGRRLLRARDDLVVLAAGFLAFAIDPSE